MKQQAVHFDDVKRLLGDVTDHKATEIVESGVTIAELEKIRIALSGDSDQIQEIGRLAPKAQDLYNLLRIDQERWEEDR